MNRRSLLILCVVGLLCELSCARNTLTTVSIVRAGSAVVRTITGADIHRYVLSMGPTQYVRFSVEQQDIALNVALFDPTGQPVGEMESPYGNRGALSVSLLTVEAGEYRIEVRPSSKRAQLGRYTLKVGEPRAQEDADLARINAERKYMQGRRLSFETGKDSWLAAVDRYREAASDWRSLEENAEEAKAFYGIAVVHRRLEEMKKAANYLDQALNLQRKAHDRRGEGYTLKELGLVYGRLEIRRSPEFLFQALPLWQAEGDKANEALVLNILGGIYDTLGMLHEGLEYLKQALAIRREIADFAGQVSTLNNIAVIYDEFGDAQTALSIYSEALSANEKVSDPNIEDRRTKARTLSNIGYTYLALGDPDKSLQYTTEALPIQKETGDRLGEVRTLTNIGYAYSAMERPVEALRSYEEALAITGETGDDWGQVYALVYLGDTYSLLGEKKKALETYREALNIEGARGDRQGRATTLDRLGRLYMISGRRQEASKCFAQALPLWRSAEDKRGEATTLLNLALFDRQARNLNKARSNAQAAINLIELLRARVIGQRERVLYFASVRKYYDVYIDILMQMHKARPSRGFDAIALQMSERARARVLLETLAEAGADVREGVAPELLLRERTLQQQIDAKADRLIRSHKENYTRDELAIAERELKTSLDDYQQVQTQIRIESPHYAALTQPETPTVEEIRRNVLDHNTVLLEYYLGEENSYVWAVTDHSMTAYELPKRTEIEAQAELVYTLMTARQDIKNESPESRQLRIKEADIRYWSAASNLSNVLLGPVASVLVKKRIVVVPDGALHYIPFFALPAPSARVKRQDRPFAEVAGLKPSSLSPMIVDHEFVDLPSVSVLHAMQRELSTRSPATKTLALFADPVFDGNDARVKSKGWLQSRMAEEPFVADAGRALRWFSATENGLSLARLRSVRHEAESIIKIVSREETLLALDFEANLPRATSSELRDYRILHFATHGLLNNENPELSAIVLSLVDESGRPINGLLQLHHIYNLNLAAELVVLSACETGSGKQIRGEGIVGLTRGFMYAGAARVVASLWKVDSVETARLMERFYRGMLVEGMRPLQALQAAQREMWSESPQEAPYYWAAFVLQGEWR